MDSTAIDATAGEANEHVALTGVGVRRRLGRRLRWNSPWSDELAVGVVAAIDYLSILAAGMLAWFLVARDDPNGSGAYLAATASAGVAVMVTLSLFKLYRLPLSRKHLRVLERILIAAGLSFAFLAVSTITIDARIRHEDSWKLAFFGLTVILLYLQRMTLPSLLEAVGQMRLITRNVAIIGAGPHGERLIHQLQQQGAPWIRIVGLFDDRIKNGRGRLPRSVAGYPVRGGTRDLMCFSRRLRIDEVFIALPWSARERINELLEQVRAIPADIYLGPDIDANTGQVHQVRVLNGMPIVTFATKPINGWAYVGKWVLDKSIALTAVLLLAPLLLMIALAIKLDSPGPVLFRQKRLGFRNRTFDVYKFRSMYHHRADANADQLTTRNDPRVSCIGGLLRKTSLDELPQLFNVLRGDMSLVGPRPHALNAKAAGQLYQDVVSEYALRHRIKPGITGWAQLNGWRGETDTEEKIVKRVEHDLYYIENWSLLLDIYIIIGTAVKAPFQKGAY